jgi:hypothetical protein
MGFDRTERGNIKYRTDEQLNIEGAKYLNVNKRHF